MVENLVAGYGPVPVVRGASLSTSSGRIVSVIGPNGAGKSTLLKGLMGILRPTSGSVLLDDRRLEGLRPDQVVRAGVGYVPQVGDVFDNLSVGENLMVGGFASRAGREQRCDEVLRLFPLLASRLKQQARTLSGGERRVLAISRALMGAPRVILLDEPSAGLSPRAMGLVWEHLERLREEGLAVLIVEQKAKQILRIADWVYVLVDGANAVEAPAAELLDDLHELGRIFMGGRRHLETTQP